MADWSKPGLASPYVDFVTEISSRDTDLAVAFDPARVTPTNLPIYTMRFRSAAKKWETWNGTAWADSADAYAINISGTAANVTGVVAAAKGGTGQSSYVIGDLLYASGAAALSKLAAVATGNVLLSGGAATAPTWGKVGLTTHVSGVLGAENGGTGVATLTGLAYGNGTGAFTAATAAQLAAVLGTTPVDSAINADKLDGYHAALFVRTVNGGTPDGAGNVSVQGIPAGAVMHFAMVSPPSGWLVANGAAVSRSTYASLFAAIGTTFGAGDGSSTFNLPNLCGEFIRGYDNGRGVDSGRAFGSYQADAMQNHDHSMNTACPSSASSGFYGSTASMSGYAAGGRYTSSLTGSPFRNASETRPRNIALLACIKF